jgi:RNA polymerase sigma factor (sigma-70 family)
VTGRPQTADAPPASDVELMDRIQQHDAGALGQLFDRYADDDYGLARTVCHRSEIAEDVVQEAFISIWRSRSTYRPMGTNVGAWVMTIVRHRAIDAVRRHHHRDGRHDVTASSDDARQFGTVKGRMRLGLSRLREDRRL